MSVAKIFVLIAWAWGVVSLFLGESAFADWGRRVFWVLLVVHAIECVIFLPKLRKLPGSLGNHLAQTMLYGVLHVQSARATAPQV